MYATLLLPTTVQCAQPALSAGAEPHATPDGPVGPTPARPRPHGLMGLRCTLYGAMALSRVPDSILFSLLQYIKRDDEHEDKIKGKSQD